MATKYDTNPLDPEFPEKAKAAAEAEMATQALPYTGAGTQRIAGAAESEEQTRRFATLGFPDYSPPYNGQFVPANYQGAAVADSDKSLSRKVSKVGLPENIVTALPYIPWYFGMVAGLVLLLIVPRSETKVRFHAAQGLAAHIGILIVTTILGFIGNITDVAEIGNFIFYTIAYIMLIIFAIKAWTGKPVHIESVDSLTNWLDEKISPKV